MLRVKDWIKSKPQFTPTKIDTDGSIISVIRSKDGLDMHVYYNMFIGNTTTNKRFYVYKWTIEKCFS